MLCVAQAGGTAGSAVKLAALKVAPSLWRSGWRRCESGWRAESSAVVGGARLLEPVLALR